MFPFLLSPSTFSCLVYFSPCFIGHAMGEGRYPCAPGATPLASPTKLTITHLLQSPTLISLLAGRCGRGTRVCTSERACGERAEWPWHCDDLYTPSMKLWSHYGPFHAHDHLIIYSWLYILLRWSCKGSGVSSRGRSRSAPSPPPFRLQRSLRESGRADKFPKYLFSLFAPSHKWV